MKKYNFNYCMPTFSNVAAAPPSSKTGDSAICAFLTAVTVFVTPATKNQ